MIQSKKLKKKIYINHGFFNRRGGRSKGIYKSLNCGIGSLDTKINIKNNIKIVCKKIGADSKKIVLMKQIHSNKILFVDKNFRFKKRIIGDAIITNIKKIPIGVLTADCAPVLLYDEKQNLISAIHAGWKGAYKGIVPKVIKFFIKKKINQKI